MPIKRVPTTVKNVAEGYVKDGVFHPIRKSWDYDEVRAGEDDTWYPEKKKAKGKAKGKAKVKAKGKAKVKAKVKAKKAPKKRSNPRNPIKNCWTDARVRRNPNTGDIQVLIEKGVKAAKTGFKTATKAVKRVAKAVNPKAITEAQTTGIYAVLAAARSRSGPNAGYNRVMSILTEFYDKPQAHHILNKLITDRYIDAIGTGGPELNLRVTPKGKALYKTSWVAKAEGLT